MVRNISRELRDGDRRSIGRANQLAQAAVGNPKAFRQLIQALWDSEPLVRMRAADAAEKASAEDKQLLAPYKAELLGLLEEATQQELRWHLAQMVPRLELSRKQRRSVARVLTSYLEDRSSIVKTFAIEGLAELADQDPSLASEVTDLIRRLTKTGTPAMRTRGRKLLERLER